MALNTTIENYSITAVKTPYCDSTYYNETFRGRLNLTLGTGAVDYNLLLDASRIVNNVCSNIIERLKVFDVDSLGA